MSVLVYIILLILLGLILMIFYGFYHFNNEVEKEKESFFNKYEKKEDLITREDLEYLPFIMKRYLEKVGVIGMCKDCNVIFKQTGRIKPNPLKGWISFSATQYMTAKHPGFIWKAKAFPLFIKDKSIDGKGEVKVSLLGFKKVALSDGIKTDISALVRCLGELIFYPIGFLSKNISWEEINDHSIKARISINNISAEGIFYFNAEGVIVSFESQRYRDEKLEYFTGKADNYKVMAGLYIPTTMKAIWNLEEGDFEYFNSDIHGYKID